MGDSIFPTAKRTRSQVVLPETLLQQVSLSRSPLKDARLARRNQVGTDTLTDAGSHGTELERVGEADQEDDELLLSPKKPLQLGNKRSPSPVAIADRPSTKRFKLTNPDSDIENEAHVRHYSDSNALPKSPRKRSATTSGSRKVKSATPSRHQSPALPIKERARSVPAFPSSTSFPTIDFHNPPRSPTRSPRSRSRTPAKFEAILRTTSGPVMSESRGLASIPDQAETADDSTPSDSTPNSSKPPAATVPTVTFAIVEEPCTPRQPHAFSFSMSPLTPLPETPHPNKFLANETPGEDRYTASEGSSNGPGLDRSASTQDTEEASHQSEDLESGVAVKTKELSDTTRIATRSRLPRPTHPVNPPSENPLAPEKVASSSKVTIPVPTAGTTRGTVASRRAAAGKAPQKQNAFEILMGKAKTTNSKSEKGKGKEEGTATAGGSKSTSQDTEVRSKKEKGKAKASVATHESKKPNTIKSKMKPKEKPKEKAAWTPRAIVIESEDEGDGSGEDQLGQCGRVGLLGKDAGRDQTLESRARPLSPTAAAEAVAPPSSSSPMNEFNDDPLVADDAILRMDDGGPMARDTPVGRDEEGSMPNDEVMHEAQSEQPFPEVAAAPSPLFSEVHAMPSPLFTEGEIEPESTEHSVLRGDVQSATDGVDVVAAEHTKALASEDVAMEDATTVPSESLQSNALKAIPLEIEPATENADEVQTPISSTAPSRTKGKRQKRIHPPPPAGSRVTRSAAGRKALGKSAPSVPALKPHSTENASETDANSKEQAGNDTKISEVAPSASAPVSSTASETAEHSGSSGSPLFTPSKSLTPAPIADDDAAMADVLPEGISHEDTMDPMSLPEHEHDVSSVSSLSDLPSEMEDGLDEEGEKKDSGSQVTQEDTPMDDVSKGSASENLTEHTSARVQKEPISSSFKSKGKAKALAADAEPPVVRRSPRDRKGAAPAATSTVSRPTRSSLAKTTASSIPVTPARAKAPLPKAPSGALEKPRSVPSPSKLGKSVSMFAARPIGHTDASSVPRTLQGGLVKGDTKALNVLENALEKLRMPPPSRPNTSMGFNRDDESDTSLEIAVKSKDDGSIGQSALGLGRPSSLQRASRVGPSALEGSSSGTSSSSTSKPRQLTQKPISMFLPVGTGPGLNGPSKRAGAIMRGTGAGRRLPIGPGSNPFGSGRGQKASQKTSLPSVMASPVKGGGVIDDADADVSMADVYDTEQGAQGHVDAPDASMIEGEDKGLMDLSELQSTSTSDKGKDKASDEHPRKPYFKRASLAAVAFSQSMSALPAQTPTSAGSMGPPATPPRREGLRSSSSNYPSSSRAGAAEDEGSSEAKPKSNVLQDCKVFVDVRSEDGEDVASWFVDALKDLGARIMTRVGPTCTHIVFKDGLLSTINRYRTLNNPKPFVVGVTWIVECLEDVKHADESRFLIDLEDFKFSGTHKRRKSMIPKLMPQLLDDNQSNDGDTSMDGSNTSINEDNLPPLARARLRQSMLLSARS